MEPAGGVQAHAELQPKLPAGPSMEPGAPSKQGTGKPIKCHRELNAKSRAQNRGTLTHSLCNGGRVSGFLPVFLILLKAVTSFLQILSPSPNLLKHKVEKKKKTTKLS